MKFVFIAAALISVTRCHPEVISSFCSQVDAVGYERTFAKFTPDELAALKQDRKRALLALRRAYDADCHHKAN